MIVVFFSVPCGILKSVYFRRNLYGTQRIPHFSQIVLFSLAHDCSSLAWWCFGFVKSGRYISTYAMSMNSRRRLVIPTRSDTNELMSDFFKDTHNERWKFESVSDEKVHSSLIFDAKTKSFGLAVTFLQLNESNRIKITTLNFVTSTKDDEDSEVSSTNVWGFGEINYELKLWNMFYHFYSYSYRFSFYK